MDIAIILAGGSGSRMKTGNIPKQYMIVKDKPIIQYCLDTFQKHTLIDGIIIVAEEEWRPFILEWIEKEGITKFQGFANPGNSRQQSIYNGLLQAKRVVEEEDVVIIHDAARPCVDDRIIRECMEGAKRVDGIMPVITVKDTIYQSRDGKIIDGLLNRDQLFAGQAPESFRFGKYLAIHENMSSEEIGNVRGSSEIAFLNELSIEMIQGSEMNFKITTSEDLKKFELIIG